MTTSGSTDYNRTTIQIIKGALRKIGVLGEGESPSGEQEQNASEALNLMVKQWQAKGLNLWTKTEAILWFNEGQQSYELGLSGTDNVADVSDTAFTELANDAASLSTSAVVVDAEGIAINDKININISSTQNHWTTVTSVAGTTVTFADALPADALSGNPVYAYTNVIARPEQIPSIRIKYFTGTEVPVRVNNRDEYFTLPNKDSTGKVNQAYYDPQLLVGELYVWNVNDDLRDTLRFTYHRPIQDFDSLANTPDFPQEWVLPMIWNLAVELAPEYGRMEEQLRLVQRKADETLNDVFGKDTDVSLYISPAIRYRTY